MGTEVTFRHGAAVLVQADLFLDSRFSILRLRHILCREAIFMCRKRQCVGVAVSALGIGLLIGCFFGNTFLQILVGAALVALGLLLPRC